MRTPPDTAYAPRTATLRHKQTNTIVTSTMKTFVCVVLFAAAALAAPEGKRDKRGFLHGYGGLSYGHGYHDYHGHYDDYHLDHGFLDHHDHAPAHIVSVKKVVSVPKVVEVKKIVSVPKVVTVPHVVKVSRYVEEPHVHVSYSHAPYHSGWW